MSKFQIILLCVFGAFIVIAVMLFSFNKGGSSSTVATVTVWGPFSALEWNQFSSGSGLTQSKTLTVTYVEKSLDTIESDFTEALAVGQGPDLIILPSDLIYKERTKLYEIPYASVPAASYQSTFAGLGDLFLTATGELGLPLATDPMVMYWNKDTFSSAGLANPISYWDEIYAAGDKLTTKDAAGNITKSVMALGETKNIPHAKDILSLLILEAGSPITDASSGQLRSVLAESSNLPINSAVAAVDFYTQFSNPEKPFYSWNRSLLPAATSFTVGDSAMYLGFASELKSLKAKNPTLNIGVAPVPQSRTTGQTITFAKLYGLSITRGAKNPAAALTAALAIVANPSAKAFADTTGLAPARRDLLTTRPSDAAGAAFYTAAIQAKGWIDPDGTKTTTVFTDLIDAVTSGRARTTEAVSDASRALQAVIDGTQ